jgi:hypothetical protein
MSRAQHAGVWHTHSLAAKEHDTPGIQGSAFIRSQWSRVRSGEERGRHAHMENWTCARNTVRMRGAAVSLGRDLAEGDPWNGAPQGNR